MTQALGALYGVARGRRWGWWMAGVSGPGLVIWMITEVVMLGYLPGAGIGMQIAMGLLGIIVLTLALVRPTGWYFGMGG